MKYCTSYDSPLGKILIAGNESEVTGLWFEGQKYFASGLEADACEKETAVFEETKRWLTIYFAGKDPGFLPPLCFHDTPFRETIWRILLQIPYGQTMTYKQIGDLYRKEEGKTTVSYRAIGAAIGRNPISLLIPCHRVIGSDGSLTGYAGGVERKKKLLELEKKSH